MPRAFRHRCALFATKLLHRRGRREARVGIPLPLRGWAAKRTDDGPATGSHFCWQKWGPMREGEGSATTQCAQFARWSASRPNPALAGEGWGGGGATAQPAPLARCSAPFSARVTLTPPPLAACCAAGASLPARKSASSAMSISRKPRMASCIAPRTPFRAPSAATDARISSSVFLRSVGGGAAASVIKDPSAISFLTYIDSDSNCQVKTSARTVNVR